MGIVASNKRVLEINETYRQWQGPRGSKDEAHDAAAAGGSGKGGSSISTQPEEKEKLLLSELVDLTEYSRVYASRVLRQQGGRVQAGKQTLEGDIRRRAPRCRSPYYDEQVKEALSKIWRVMDYICGKRLQPALAELVIVLERHKRTALPCDN